jgi:hypothetical protein
VVKLFIPHHLNTELLITAKKLMESWSAEEVFPCSKRKLPPDGRDAEISYIF